MKHRYRTQVTIGGEKKTLSFSNNFWYLLHEKCGKAFAEMWALFRKDERGSVEQQELVLNMILAGLEAYDREEKLPVTEYDAFELRDDAYDIDPEECTELVRVMMLSKGIDIVKLAEELGKKKDSKSTKKK